jgi:hypothetical protein
MRFKEDKFHGYLWNRMASNGWCWEKKRSLEIDDYEVYSMTFLVTYEVKVYACISSSSKHLCNDGHYGVMWLEAEYEYDRPHSIGELGEMKEGMAYAEDNLLLIGVPFVPDYKFIDNAEEKTKRNMELRDKLNLEKQEEEDDE